MPETLTETPTAGVAVVVPQPGEPRTAASVRAPFLALADRAAYCEQAIAAINAGTVTHVAALPITAALNWGDKRVSAASGLVVDPTASPGGRIHPLVKPFPNGNPWASRGFIVRSSAPSWWYTLDMGHTWTAMAGPSLSTTDMHAGTIFGSGKIAAVGGTNIVRRSSDIGANWASSSPLTANVTRLGTIDETWLAWDHVGSISAQIHRSTDLVSWAGVTVPPNWDTKAKLGVVDSGGYIANKAMLLPQSFNGAGGADTTSVLYTSDGGNTWSQTPGFLVSGTPTCGGGCYNPTLDRWLVVGTDGQVWYTSNFIAWNWANAGVGLLGVRSFAGIFVALGADGALYWSQFGLVWSPLHEYATDGVWQDIMLVDSRLVVARHIDPVGADDHELEYMPSLRLPQGSF